MSQQYVTAILSTAQKDWNSLRNIEQVEEYANLTPEEKSAFRNLDIVQARKFIDSASTIKGNTQTLALANIVYLNS